MDYQTAKTINRLYRLEQRGPTYLEIGMRTGDPVRVARAARLLEAVYAKDMSIVMSEVTAYRSR